MIDDIKHVFNRGINKQDVFNNDSDRKRFVESLYKFNNVAGAIRSEAEDIFKDPPSQEKLVDILKWTIMPNHFHLLLQEKVDGGITEFMKRLGNGYTKYFNIKNKRSGYLFQNTAKMVLLENNRQFIYIPFYVDLNVLDIFYPNWKKTGLTNTKKALQTLKDYQWSSFSDYVNKEKRGYSSIINKDSFYELFDLKEKAYQKELIKLIKYPLKADNNF